MKPSSRSREELSNFVHEFIPSEPDDPAALRALAQSLKAANAGTYGVGALIIDSDDGSIVCEGGNGVHINGFHSDLHAEMVVLNEFESVPRAKNAGSYTLVSSLEPCPMCMTRLIFSGIGNVRYLCPDDIGGMVQRKDQLPPVFLGMTEAAGQVWGEAECSAPLRQAAFDVWNESQEALDQKVVERSTGKGRGQLAVAGDDC